MLCDECLTVDFEQPSPKRKGLAPIFVQRTLNANLALSVPPVNESPSNKTATAKPTTQKLIESLSLELKKNTATISALKSSVDSMRGVITQQKVAVSKSIGINNENISSIKPSLNESQHLIHSVKDQSYSNVVKDTSNQRTQSEVETPKPSKTSRANKSNKTKAPAVFGTSSNVIGKPLSPNQPRPKKKMTEKAVWISRLHRDTSEEDVLSYIRHDLGITAFDQLEIRKLVKKDRDISEYSFVSFRIVCPANVFDTLLDASSWPSNCRMREFKMKMNQSLGARLNVKSPSTHREETSHKSQTPQQPMTMETV